jgi:DNA mismatch repair ATPase MutS
MFFEDAQVASKELGIALTKKQKPPKFFPEGLKNGKRGLHHE